ncbi:hypothetical protein M409DRAFT_35843 [Zasmidium cellare ATCC 36951]|uniref:Uncharacterized protein n=1 Tax=Zasmidium cellare ATCC 36951 TaxID=1080233 RepID=A0A6A6CUL5_ZASCE|nr:uncharacterized protein M409DRAFT_35843 [Zasmidium cellare ATCC 36951]KAF2170854.1 hypothetical protein M409DRAFT_35843 [Zasmidium cellare ATCC 36951]
MSSSSTVLITGTKAGIGKALLETFAARPNHTVIAAIRDAVDSSPAKSLAATAVGTGSKIIVAQYDAGFETAAEQLISHLKSNYNIQSLDIVIANAGILRHSKLVKDSAAEDFVEHFRINTVGPILLYKATTNLLNASKQTPKFFIISSTLGSNAKMDGYPMPLSAYGVSKAAANWIAGKIHREEERVVVVPIQPGWVQTSMGERAAEVAGMSASDVPVTIKDSVQGIVNVVDKATKADHSGRFWDQEGNELPW